MEEELITFLTAKLAKEKGFKSNNVLDGFTENRKELWMNIRHDDSIDEKPFNTMILRPTQSLLQKYIREEHGMLIYVRHFGQNWYEWVIQTNKIVECDGRIWGG